MFNFEKTQDTSWQKTESLGHEIPITNIKGLYRAEHYSLRDMQARLENATKEKYRHNELFRSWCSINDFIDAPLEYVWSYVANIHSLEEWSFGIRTIHHVGNGVYSGQDHHQATQIFVRNEAIREAHVVNYYYGLEQKKEFGVRHYLRFIDAREVFERPGTLLMWSHFKHSSSLQTQNESLWCGDNWPYVYAALKLEADNLRFIVEHRYHNRK